MNQTMKNHLALLLLTAVLGSLFGITQPLHAQGTAFTYQGRLNNNGSPATGSYDLIFTLYDANQPGGNLVAGPLTNAATAVSNGLFTVTLDFGTVFNGSARWLEISVQTNGGGGFATLSPRQQLTPAAYSIYANTAGNVSGVLPTSILPGFQSPLYSTVSGGSSNIAGLYASVGGGNDNKATGDYSTVGSGKGNTASGGTSTVGGGESNSATNVWATVSGGIDNLAGGFASIVGGGYQNYAIGTQYSTVSGGTFNHASGSSSSIGGGADNEATNSYATVSGGNENIAGGQYATVSGGELNIAPGQSSSISGGYGNLAAGDFSAIGGGGYNHATNVYATVPGGYLNLAGGQYSFAAGRAAQALHDGSFVWADDSVLNATFSSTATNQFLIRAQGGVGIGANNPAAQLQVTSGGSLSNPQLRLDQTNSGDYARIRMTSGVTGGVWDIAAGGGAPNVLNFFVSPTVGGSGTNVLTLRANGNATVWGTVTANGVLLTSDRNAKENFTPLDPEGVLAKVASLRVTEWNYKVDSTDQKHIGPMAQDFHNAFGLNGNDDQHISMVDEGGVALAAIQGLNEKLEKQSRAKDAEIQELKLKVDELSRLVRQLVPAK